MVIGTNSTQQSSLMTTKTHFKISIEVRKLGFDVIASNLFQNPLEIFGNDESYIIEKLKLYLENTLVLKLIRTPRETSTPVSLA